MNGRKVASDIPDHIKPMVDSAEAFREAITDHQEKENASVARSR